MNSLFLRWFAQQSNGCDSPRLQSPVPRAAECERDQSWQILELKLRNHQNNPFSL